jgi:hypothetical protein
MRYRVNLSTALAPLQQLRSSGPGVRRVRGQPEFTSVIGLTFSVSQRRFSGRRKTLASDNIDQGNAECMNVTSTGSTIKVTEVKSRLQYPSRVSRYHQSITSKPCIAVFVVIT